ncbi:nucleotidyl transferase AbiEii/AbiGii toxin family protein [Trichlorobacter sp.]|uniref:nucleotidyl transferase AbiEii/AbiGii toxin family protein n=1 Tax=Trichlorobacter sp. TaxID=2911007 RepID=UPI002A35A595|nr:nucleotidyl transferase AbiEii/AbiGii toxin family protein [Trichlorobacter sp.]MDY0384749.1 nucleotidyl transferase AbiEii/AbiGii toxin family protein [Trichlorobacter sp.]
MFKRPFHQRIARVLTSLDGDLLKSRHCLFGGGTVIALRFGEYRESVDIDFLVSDLNGYRNVRQRMTADGISAIMLPGKTDLLQARGIRADQYGIRTMLSVDDQLIKFEIVLEGRINLAAPSAQDSLCGIATLTTLDMATSKLLANSDRWADDGVFSRDLIDLAMMQPGLPLLRKALAKAEGAYGDTIRSDLEKAIQHIQTRHGWLERCMQAMAMTSPKALVWQRIRTLHKALSAVKAPAD